MLTVHRQQQCPFPAWLSPTSCSTTASTTTLPRYRYHITFTALPLPPPTKTNGTMANFVAQSILYCRRLLPLFSQPILLFECSCLWTKCHHHTCITCSCPKNIIFEGMFSLRSRISMTKTGWKDYIVPPQIEVKVQVIARDEEWGSWKCTLLHILWWWTMHCNDVSRHLWNW